MNKEELYKIALSNVHRYSLLNEIFAIRDERFPKEQQDNMLCVNGYIGIDTLSRYVRYIDELVEYQNIDTIKNLKEKDKEIDRLNKQLKWDYKEINRLRNIINELEKDAIELMKNYKDINAPRYDMCKHFIYKLKELKEKE